MQLRSAEAATRAMSEGHSSHARSRARAPARGQRVRRRRGGAPALDRRWGGGSVARGRVGAPEGRGDWWRGGVTGGAWRVPPCAWRRGERAEGRAEGQSGGAATPGRPTAARTCSAAAAGAGLRRAARRPGRGAPCIQSAHGAVPRASAHRHPAWRRYRRGRRRWRRPWWSRCRGGAAASGSRSPSAPAGGTPADCE